MSYVHACISKGAWGICMFSNICFVYPWATLGGVERVFLNRLMSFQHATPTLQVDVLFLHDSGGAVPLRAALAREGIAARVLVAPDFEPGAVYDMVFCVDCPQAFALCERHGFRYLAECHTSYEQNRRYLQKLPSRCERVVVPSALFGDRLRGELPDSIAAKVTVLRNFVPWDLAQRHNDLRAPSWVRRPLLFFGRMDWHKNPVMLLDALVQLNAKEDQRFFALMCGPFSPEIDMTQEIESRRLHSQVLMMPPIPFAASNTFLSMVKDAGGIYVSPSKGESFGLAAAEAMGSGMPVLLSDLPEHRFLVQGSEEDLVFNQKITESLTDGILRVTENYSEYSSKVKEVRIRFSASSFMNDWHDLLKGLK